MIIEAIFVLPIYVAIFVMIYRFLNIIKAMTEANDIISELISETENPAAQSDINKRDFFVRKD